MQAVCEVSLEAIASNFNYVKNRIGFADVIPVVKANAYGHGAVRVSQYLYEQLGVKLFAVATLEEARELAKINPQISILIFSRIFHHEVAQVPENAILSIGSMEDAAALASQSTRRLSVHLNVNTGMNRLGLTAEQALELVADRSCTLDIQGVYSHFSSSDTQSEYAFNEQRTIFKTLVERLHQHGFKGMIHLANSAASLNARLEKHHAVRLGISLYGYDTTPGKSHQSNLIPAMTIKAPLLRVERIRAGASVSYGEQWTAAVDTHIGTLRIGYADGYRRDLTNRAWVSYDGTLFPVVGTVTMDHIMIDLGEASPKTGTMFTVAGGRSQELGISAISERLNTIPYEFCCGISERVKRVYDGGGN